MAIPAIRTPSFMIKRMMPDRSALSAMLKPHPACPLGDEAREGAVEPHHGEEQRTR